MIHQHLDIQFGHLSHGYVTYPQEVFGFSAAAQRDSIQLLNVSKWLLTARRPLLAYLASSSVTGFVSRATAVQADDIKALPYPDSHDFGLSAAEQILVDDIVDYYRDLIRLGEDSTAMKETGLAALPSFNDIYTEEINAVYKKNKLRALEPQVWPGLICQPFAFGKGKVDWEGADE